MAKSIDTELVKTPLIDLITGYQDSLVLGFINQQLEERINKAIEYIEDVAVVDYEKGTSHDLYDTQIFKVIRILRGETDE